MRCYAHAVFIAVSMAELSDEAQLESKTSLVVSCSSCSEEDLAVLGIQPYRFKPYAEPYELVEAFNEEVKQNLNRLQSIDW